MKKARKILTLILVFVLLAGVFSGCAMFTRNTARYRALVAVTVGDEEITVGKILDNFNNYYNTYSAYIGQGLTVDWLLQMTMQSVVTQAMKVDSYTSPDHVESHKYADFCHNAQYLTLEEIEYSIRYVKHLTFESLDSSVQTQLAVNRTIGDEETEDTSRDFTKPDELKADTYSEHVYRNRVFNEEAAEYFDKYYGGQDNIAVNAKIDDYVTAESISAKVENLNGRLDKDDEPITVEEYKKAQEKVVSQYQRTIKNSYNIEFEKFILNQIEDMVASIIAAKYDYNVNKTIDTTNLNDTLDTLKANLKINTDAQAAGFNLNDNFVEFIEALSSTSYIYSVPDKPEYNYIFVKNILIPFNAQQKAMLSNLAKDLGGDTTKPAYVQLRNELATQIMADDFESEKDDDGKYSKIGGLFDIAKDAEGNDKLIIKADENNPLAKVFKAEGVVDQDEYASKDEAVIAYMKRFNTDTAQHTAMYDYVVRVGTVPSDYTAKWVPEFVDAANEAWEKGENSYALAISTYGVHIVYYTANVVAQDINFTAENILKTTTPEYRLFNAYFSQQSSRLLQDNLEALQKSYLEGEKIKTNSNFERFLKDNGFTFNLIEFLTDDED